MKFTLNWLKAAAIRALKTAAQTTIGFLAVGTIYEVDLRALTGGVAIATLLSVVTSLAGLPETKTTNEDE